MINNNEFFKRIYFESDLHKAIQGISKNKTLKSFKLIQYEELRIKNAIDLIK